MKTQNQKIDLKLSFKEQLHCALNREIIITEYYEIENKLFDNEGNMITVYVQHAPNALNALGLAISGAVKCTDGRYCIWYDDRFKQLPDFVQDFVISHELGHLERMTQTEKPLIKWYDNILRACGLSVKSNSEEYYADFHASQVIGMDKAVKALEWMKENIKFTKTMDMECRKRLAVLQSY